MTNAMPIPCSTYETLVWWHLHEIGRDFERMNNMNGPSGRSWGQFIARKLAGSSLEELTLAQVRELFSQWKAAFDAAVAGGADCWDAATAAAAA